MKKAEELQDQLAEIEDVIQTMLDEFIAENGVCHFDIQVQQRSMETNASGTIYLPVSVKVLATIQNMSK